MVSYRKTTFISDWLKWESGTSVLKFENTTHKFSTNKNSVVAIFFNLKPYGGSRTLNNQFTSSQKSVRFCRKNHRQTERKAAKKASKTLRRIKKGIRLCLYEKNSLEHITRGYSGPGNAGGVCSSVPMWYLGAPSILKCLLRNVQKFYTWVYNIEINYVLISRRWKYVLNDKHVYVFLFTKSFTFMLVFPKDRVF